MPHYTQRLDYRRQLISRFKDRKVIIHERLLNRKFVEFSWPFAYENWMLSIIENEQTASLNATHDMRLFDKYRDTCTAFIGIQIYDYSTLPDRYFKFADTLSRYEILE
jgi:hypothetical protein